MYHAVSRYDSKRNFGQVHLNVENKQNILKLEKGTNMGEKTILARLAVAFPGSVGRIPRVVLYAYFERDSR